MLSWWRCQHMFVFLLLQLSMMGKTLPVTTNCTNGKKEKKNNKKKTTLALADIICSRPWFPLNVAPAAQTAPLVIQLCLCQVWQAERCLRKLTWSPGKRVPLSLCLRDRLSIISDGGLPGAALPASTVQTVVLLVCLPFCSQPAPVELLFFFLLTSSFCLLALVAPTKYPHLSRHFQQTRSKKKKKTAPLLSITINPSRANYDPMTPLSHQKKTKKTDKKRMGEEGMEGGGGERSSL